MFQIWYFTFLTSCYFIVDDKNTMVNLIMQKYNFPLSWRHSTNLEHVIRYVQTLDKSFDVFLKSAYSAWSTVNLKVSPILMHFSSGFVRWQRNVWIMYHVNHMNYLVRYTSKETHIQRYRQQMITFTKAAITTNGVSEPLNILLKTIQRVWRNSLLHGTRTTKIEH